MKNYKEEFKFVDGIGILKYKKHWWSKWEYCFDFETQKL